VELENLKDDFEREGLGIIAISPDSQEMLQKFAEKKNITFPLLSDAGSEAIKRYGILNQNIDKDNPIYGIPFPGQYVVDKNRVVQAKYFENNHRERMTTEAVLIRSTGWRPESMGAVDTNELTVRYASGQTTVRPGNHITLVLEVSPKKNMRVYAPGVEGYTPFTWELKQSDLYRGGEAEFPTPQLLHMKVINETVPAYQRPFRVLQDVEIAPRQFLSRDLGDITKNPNLTVRGTLKYQACDDRTCYLPKTMELEFVFKVDGHEWTLTSSP
jgi:hypothetical protein